MKQSGARVFRRLRQGEPCRTVLPGTVKRRAASFVSLGVARPESIAREIVMSASKPTAAKIAKLRSRAWFNNPDNISGSLIPTTSVDQYGATLGRWFGASESELDVIFPRLAGFPTRNLGFL